MRRVWARRLESLAAEQRRFYVFNLEPAEIRAWQLHRFNEQWGDIRARVPHYRSRRHELPERFEAWEQVRELLPATDRSSLQILGDHLIDTARRPHSYRFTGGTTAQPVRIPVCRSEAAVARADAWHARAWYGIRPTDPLFLIWGHSHLLGSGLAGRFNALVRRAKDAALGYRRHSAYEIGEEALHHAGQKLLDHRSHWVLSYAVALDRWARVNCNRSSAFHRLGLKAAVATAESFPRADSRERIADVLGCPVTMEYGTVETGPLAHEHPDGGYRVFWRHWFLEGLPIPHTGGEKTWEIAVTSLYPRSLPLVRYRVGDLVVGEEGELVRAFAHVAGRCNDAVELVDGRAIHSEAFTHAVRDFPDVRAFQVVQSAGGGISLTYVSPRPLDDAEIRTLRQRLGRVDQALSTIVIQRVESLPTTVAGKTKPIRRED